MEAAEASSSPAQDTAEQQQQQQEQQQEEEEQQPEEQQQLGQEASQGADAAGLLQVGAAGGREAAAADAASSTQPEQQQQQQAVGDAEGVPPAASATHGEATHDAAEEPQAAADEHGPASPPVPGEDADAAAHQAAADAEAAAGPAAAAAAGDEASAGGDAAAEFTAAESTAGDSLTGAPAAGGAAAAADTAALAEAAVAGAPADVATTAAAPEAASPVQEAAEAADAAKAAQLDTNTRQPDRAYFVDGVKAIDVEVDYGQGPCRLVHVAIDVSGLQPSSKPFLGGFRHKQTGITFHHASMQTQGEDAGTQHSRAGLKQGAAAAAAAGAGSDEGGGCSLVKLTRETQTVKAASSSCQTLREAATQVAVPGLLLDCSGDRVLTPRPYVTAAVVEQRRAAAALAIQRFTRGWLARTRAATLRAIKAERDGFLSKAAAEATQAAHDHKRREVERRTHLLSKADFTLLQHELDAWQQQQAAAIKAAGLQPHEEQAALQLLLAKETRLLQTLDRLRVNAHHETKARSTQQQLGSLAAPKTWPLRNGKKVLVHTPLTVRAAELQQLYRGLMLSSLSLDERLDVLLHVKWVAKEFDCRLTRELVELIDREADLLNRGRVPATMDGLRRRIAGLFLSFCQNPDFNPEAARLRVNAVGARGPESYEYVLEA